MVLLWIIDYVYVCVFLHQDIIDYVCAFSDEEVASQEATESSYHDDQSFPEVASAPNLQVRPIGFTTDKEKL